MESAEATGIAALKGLIIPVPNDIPGIEQISKCPTC